jgi:CHAT domain-containing protein
MTPGAANFRLAGLAYEGADQFNSARENFEQSIAKLEQARGSYSVIERTAFFRSEPARESYWGLIRILSKTAVQSGQKDDVLVAIQATERIRARQLGELLDQQGQAVSVQSLGQLREQLDGDTLILDYILTDQAIVLLALAKEGQGAWVIPYQKRDFDGNLRKIAQALADPSSDSQALARELSAISQTLLSPAANLLKSKKQLLVLPDGSLNLIPFDLLTATPNAYRPLVQDVVVRVVPSLRLLQAQTANQAAAGTVTGLAAR